MASIRRRLMTQRGEDNGGLPSGYYPCEYIYSDGNAYIDTGYKHNNNTRVQMKAQAVGAITGNVFLFDGPNANGTRKGVFYQVSKNSWAVDYAKSTARQYLSAGANDMLEIDFNKNVCTVNGETKTFTASSFQSTVSLTLLCSNFGGIPQSFIKAKLYHCAIWDNDVLVRDYVPCINESNVYGLYDLVNGVFYQSAGTSQFGEVPVVYDFAYTGGEQVVQLNPGTYKLECWGAQWGSWNDPNTHADGGKGAYIEGKIEVSAKTTVYINVGGKGSDTPSEWLGYNIPNPGGYNGGGNGGGASAAKATGGGGGGATHIALRSGILPSLEPYYEESLIIVAAGGGGAGGAGVYGEDGNIDTQGAPGGYGGSVSGGQNGPSMVYFFGDICGVGGYGGTNVSGGKYGDGGIGAVNDSGGWPEDSGSGGGGGGGVYAGGGGGGGAIQGGRFLNGYDGLSGSFGLGGEGGNGKSIVMGYRAGPGGGGGGGASWYSSSLNIFSHRTSINGNTSMPAPAVGTQVGHSGNGYARITKI